jgi:hypothetical protein
MFLPKEIVIACHTSSLPSQNSHTTRYSDTLMYVKPVARALGILVAAVGCAVLFGVGIPLFWIWVASRVQTTTGYGVSGLAAVIVVAGPLASFFTLVFLVGRFGGGERPAQPMAWMRSRDEVRHSARSTTSFEQVLILTTFLVLIAFNIWFFFFARCPSTQCFGH